MLYPISSSRLREQKLILCIGETPKTIVKDGDKMPFTNETLKAAVRDYLKQADIVDRNTRYAKSTVIEPIF